MIELMIVVAIIGILTAIAIPLYQDYVTRTRWSDNLASLGQLKAAVGECMQTQNGNNQAPVDCSDAADGGALEVNGYLGSDWTGPATPKYSASAPTVVKVGLNAVQFTLVGNAEGANCTVTLTGTSELNELHWEFVNAGGLGCNRARTGVGT